MEECLIDEDGCELLGHNWVRDFEGDGEDVICEDCGEWADGDD